MKLRSDEKRAEKAAAATKQQVDREEQAFLASPIGRARTAHVAGDEFFQYAAPVSKTQRTVAGIFTGDQMTKRNESTNADVLGGIEREGWRLSDVGYVFEQTGSVSRDKLLSSGQTESVMGNVLGVYLFRRA